MKSSKISLFVLSVFTLASCNSNVFLSEQSSTFSSSAASESSYEETPACSLISLTGGKVDDGTAFMLVSHDTSSVSLSEKVVVSSGCVWSLYRGESEIPTKVASGLNGDFSDGDNVFYIVVRDPNRRQDRTYKLTIYRSFAVQVSYYFDDVFLGNDIAYTGYNFELPKDQLIEGYDFSYWINEANEQVSDVILWSNSRFYAVASAKLNSLSVVSKDESMGTVKIASGSGYSGETITVVATPKGNNVFAGWYDKKGKQSDETRFTFKMPTSDYSLEGHFITYEEAQRPWNIAHGVIPSVSANYVTYGLYPQSIVSNKELASQLNILTNPDSNGWYYYENEYYARAVASSSTYFSNGEKCVPEETYWFICEPIKWRILSKNENDYFLLSDVCLDYKAYDKDGWAPDFWGTHICKWLNDEFYKAAFHLNREYISKTAVDDTSINVFLLSANDYLQKDYGFLDYYGKLSSRVCRATDWARSKGGDSTLDYWTRTKPSIYDAYYVTSGGELKTNRTLNAGGGARPSVTLKIPEINLYKAMVGTTHCIFR